MGQRLNIEIHKDGKVLANAYYHWSGYTSSALPLTQKIIEQVDNIQESNDILYAISLLEVTGARLTKDELPFAKKLAPERDFQLAISRNDGLIAISEEGINLTRNWEEARVEICLSSRVVGFFVYSLDYQSEFVRLYGKEEYNKIPYFRFDYPFDSIPFHEFFSFASAIENLIKQGIYSIKLTDKEDSDIICFIE